MQSVGRLAQCVAALCGFAASIPVDSRHGLTKSRHRYLQPEQAELNISQSCVLLVKESVRIGSWMDLECRVVRCCVFLGVRGSPAAEVETESLGVLRSQIQPA